MNLDPRDRAILETVSFADAFDFPLTLREISRDLIGVDLSERELAKWVAESRALARKLDSRGRYWFLRGREKLVERRLERRAAVEAVLKQHSAFLTSVRLVPFVRMVAFAAADGDRIDLLVATRKGRAASVRLAIGLLAPFDSVRRVVCVDERQLDVSRRREITQISLADLVPVYGLSMWRLFTEANGWAARFFWSTRVLDLATPRDPSRFRRVTETILSLGFSPIERFAASRMRRSRAW